MSIVIPAVLPKSEDELKETIGRFSANPSVSCVQIDVVDGKFASPPTWPYTAPGELLDMLYRHEMLPYLERMSYEIDLMCFDAVQAAKPWVSLGATRLTFHAESTPDLMKLLAAAREVYGAGTHFAPPPGLISFGLALNIESDLALIEPCLTEIDYVQFMGIAKIGRQGQPFDERVFENIRIFKSRYPHVPVQVDGGVSLMQAKKLLALGVTSVVVGSAFLRSRDPAAFLAAFENLQSPYGV